MPIIKTEAFVLKSFKYGETSKIVTLFTKDFGKISAILKGARNYRSRSCGVLETMNYINSVIYYKENKDIHMLSTAEYIRSFPEILRNYEKLQTSYRIIEIINKSLFENEVNKSVFDLLIRTYERLNNCDNDLEFNILFFQIELIKIMGLGPDLSKSNETFLDFIELPLDKNQKTLLGIFIKHNFEELINMDIEKEDVNRLIESYERFLLSHTNGSKFYTTKKIMLELNKFI